MFTFTARNAAQLSKQVDEAENAIPGLTINYGRQGDTHLWFIHGAWGHQLKDRLNFSQLVEECNRRAKQAS